MNCSEKEQAIKLSQDIDVALRDWSAESHHTPLAGKRIFRVKGDLSPQQELVVKQLFAELAEVTASENREHWERIVARLEERHVRKARLLDRLLFAAMMFFGVALVSEAANPPQRWEDLLTMLPAALSALAALAGVFLCTHFDRKIHSEERHLTKDIQSTLEHCN